MRVPISNIGGSWCVPKYYKGKLHHFLWVSPKKVTRLKRMHSNYQRKKRGW